MHLIQALRLPNSIAVMTNIARYHYANMYNRPLIPIVFGRNALLTLQTTQKGYIRNFRLLHLRYSSVIFDAQQISVIHSNGIDAISSGFSGCYMASFTFGNNRYVAHIPMTGGNVTQAIWNAAVLNNIISNVVLFRPTEGIASRSRLIGTWGIITHNDRCYRLEVNEIAPQSPINTGQRIFISIPSPPILTEIPPIPNGIIP